MNEQDPNIGQQFTGIIGNNLIRDSLSRIEKLRNISKPEADKVFSNHLASDSEILNHPAVKVHNNLFHAHHHMEQALEYNDKYDKIMAIHHAILSHKSLMEALKSGIEVPGFMNEAEYAYNHFDQITQNMTKLNALYGEKSE